MRTSVTPDAARGLQARPRRKVIACGMIAAALAIGGLLSGCSGSDDPAANRPGGPCADSPLDTAPQADSFVPTVEYYSITDGGRTIVLYAEVDVVTDSYFMGWAEEDDRVFISLNLFGSPPEGPDFLYNELTVELETPLGGRHVCYGTTELTEKTGLG